MTDERVEQATASPGETRNVDVPLHERRCWKSVGVGFERCQLEVGHVGDCDSTRHVFADDAATAGDDNG